MSLRDLCTQYGIRFKKQLGQNLLLDDNINRIMVDAAALTPEDDVVEVGAGLGALTQHLYKKAGRVLSIEIDKSFMPCLEDQFREALNVRLFRGDVLNHSVPKLLSEFLPGGMSYKMVANLPYYITTPILFHFLESPVHFDRLVVMVQEEVAKRLVAPAGIKEFGVLTLAAHLYADVDIVHRVPRSCFVPRPQVDSSIVRFRVRSKPRYPELEPKFLMSVVRAAFSARRKTMRNSLTHSGGFGVKPELVMEAFQVSGIDPGRRPESMSLDEFALLAREMKARL